MKTISIPVLTCKPNDLVTGMSLEITIDDQWLVRAVARSPRVARLANAREDRIQTFRDGLGGRASEATHRVMYSRIVEEGGRDREAVSVFPIGMVGGRPEGYLDSELTQEIRRTCPTLVLPVDIDIVAIVDVCKEEGIL